MKLSLGGHVTGILGVLARSAGGTGKTQRRTHAPSTPVGFILGPIEYVARGQHVRNGRIEYVCSRLPFDPTKFQ
ncbi:hypothetical protein [Sphingomonas sp. Leaf242]|uniref:hypothetical protein n=1 Tax=Sphingomonas sp. Leaf242 TaxID=1736304 RepID=UPI0012E192D1|nr:hypothetical protein [Sphingomonas sp. Leaf242]